MVACAMATVRTHEVLNAYIQCLTPKGYQSAMRKSAQDQ